MLIESELIITFIKKNGVTRIMRCTLHESIIPKKYSFTGDELPPNDSDLITVFDLDANNWRSMHVANITGVEICL